ncbi:DUF1353 domain-containing protein [Nocardioides jiangxiensis]|uniref:DUF1353 domain-containing protein n=1 Tax=Nocardioides jiangxiensis TaxID=3064524 RepID=A0ABT9B1X2_9ACTN|nr:DUF1353 domain-containing protein [Nocardioides sp. WY-20]MDO7868850.1 DUF1353 domain-containing protein [Nocardioides sp. WY-20]
MEPEAPIPHEPRRFFDGGVAPSHDQPEVPPDDLADPRIVLERRLDPAGRERLLMLRRIGYLDRRFGPLLVPARADFLTDLASVPALFTWLVPKTGAHLPAALLHDGLCHQGAFVSPDGRRVALTRVDADRIFRDAMADAGTPLVRRWLVWAAVTTNTLWRGRDNRWSAARQWRYRLAVVGTLGLVAVLGVLATLDLADVLEVVPWMGHGSFLAELARGGAMAVVLPALLGLLWGRFRVAGWIMCIGLALLLHVTIALAFLTGLYWAAEAAAALLTRRRTSGSSAGQRSE